MRRPIYPDIPALLGHAVMVGAFDWGHTAQLLVGALNHVLIRVDATSFITYPEQMLILILAH